MIWGDIGRARVAPDSGFGVQTRLAFRRAPRALRVTHSAGLWRLHTEVGFALETLGKIGIAAPFVSRDERVLAQRARHRDAPTLIALHRRQGVGRRSVLDPPHHRIELTGGIGPAPPPQCATPGAMNSLANCAVFGPLTARRRCQ